MTPVSLTLFAGMGRPSAVLTEAAKLRLEVISFFLLAFLLSAFAVRWLWNGLAKDFPLLRRLSYPRALGLLTLWGGLAMLVLVMISGARELMTPGAWKKDGVTYKLAEAAPPRTDPPGPTADDRRKALDDLRAALWDYARVHDGALPPGRDDPAIPPDRWRTAHPSGMRFVYVPGRKVDPYARLVVAYEPDVFGGDRFALYADGETRKLSPGELTESLAPNGGK